MAKFNALAFRKANGTFVELVERMSPVELKAEVVKYSEQERICQAELEDENENKTGAKVKELKDLLKEITGPYNDVLTACKQKRRYILDMLKEIEGEHTANPMRDDEE